VVVRGRRHALAPPAADIGNRHLDIADQVNLRLDQYPPTTRTAITLVVKAMYLAPQSGFDP
jgi:hypothetical protein